MNWTNQDLQDFLQRYRSARDLAAQSESIAPQQDDLQSLRLGNGNSAAIGPSGKADDFRQQLDAGGRVRPPERLRRQIEEFQKALQQRP
jgi:hypothetical protein